MDRRVTRGDTVAIEYYVIDPFTNAPADLAAPSSKAAFTVKQFLSDPDERALWRGSLGIGVYAFGGGRVIVEISARATAVFPDGLVVYDFVLLVNGRRWVEERGTFVVQPGVTQRRE